MRGVSTECVPWTAERPLQDGDFAWSQTGRGNVIEVGPITVSTITTAIKNVCVSAEKTALEDTDVRIRRQW